MPRILVVEDEFLIRLTLTEVLGDDGFDVTEAEDGEQAVALLGSAGTFDLLMTDVNLPGKLSGWAVADAARCSPGELARRVRNRRRAAPGRAASLAPRCLRAEALHPLRHHRRRPAHDRPGLASLDKAVRLPHLARNASKELPEHDTAVPAHG